MGCKDTYYFKTLIDIACEINKQYDVNKNKSVDDGKSKKNKRNGCVWWVWSYYNYIKHRQIDCVICDLIEGWIVYIIFQSLSYTIIF